MLVAISATAGAQPKAGKPKRATQAKPASHNAEKWIRVGIDKHGFSFAHPEYYKIGQLEHPDSEEGVNANEEMRPTDFNAIEVNRDGAEKGEPYMMVYSIPKQVQQWEYYGQNLQREISAFGGKIVGADTTFTLQGHKGFDVTFEMSDNIAKVRSIVVYAHGRRYGFMYTVMDDKTGTRFVDSMPLFERLLETVQLKP